MNQALAVFAVLLLVPLTAPQATEIDLRDFGAAGNGKADDTAALEKAVAALAAAPKPAVSRFEAGRTYRIATGAGYAIRIQGQASIRIEGAWATLLLGAERRGVAVQGCRDVAVRGLRVVSGVLASARPAPGQRRLERPDRHPRLRSRHQPRSQASVHRLVYPSAALFGVSMATETACSVRLL